MTARQNDNALSSAIDEAYTTAACAPWPLDGDRAIKQWCGNVERRLAKVRAIMAKGKRK
jgi:hypothetical protein